MAQAEAGKARPGLHRVAIYIQEKHYEQLEWERVRRGYKSLSRTGREVLLEGLRSIERDRQRNTLQAMDASREAAAWGR